MIIQHLQPVFECSTFLAETRHLSFRAIYTERVFLPRATKLGQGNIFRSVCQQFCPRGVCVVARGGMHGFIWGVCVVLFGGAYVVSFGGACVVLFGGACMVLFGGHAWFYSGGMCGFIQWGVRGFIQWGAGACVVLFSGGACVVLFRGGMHGFFSFSGYNEIRSMSGRYASYWNAFLFFCVLL